MNFIFERHDFKVGQDQFQDENIACEEDDQGILILIYNAEVFAIY